VLIADAGLRGVVLRLSAPAFATISRAPVPGGRPDELLLRAGAGSSLPQLVLRARLEGLPGLVFAAGIPGSLGGAVIMNAGTSAGQLSDVLIEVEVVTRDGELQRLPAARCGLGYRCSRLPAGSVVVAATLRLTQGDPRPVGEAIDRYLARRRATQPSGATAGCVFKNPPGEHAGKLIEQAGLKGTAIGMAEVSAVHANFIVARRGATAAEIHALIRQVQQRVHAASGVRLQPENLLLGFAAGAAAGPATCDEEGSVNDMMPFKGARVVVLYGGLSSERAVSLLSGTLVAAALTRLGYDVLHLDVGRDLAARLQEIQPDVCFNALHGTYGEDGCVQGLLELLGIPYTGSGPLASALAMDKVRTKQLLLQAGLPTPEFRLVEPGPLGEEVENPFGFPVVVKPASEGSSVGVSIVHEPEELHRAVVTAASCGDGRVLLEQWVEGAEVTVGVLAGRALASTEIVYGEEFYDYRAKYESDGTRYHTPARLPEPTLRRLHELAEQAVEVLGARAAPGSTSSWRATAAPTCSRSTPCRA